MFEYVSKKEYQPIRNKLESIIREVQNEIRPNITFQYALIGSGSKHLITRNIKGNQGYDFDYNLIIKKASEDYNSPEKIRKTIFSAFRKVLKNTPYKDPEDSTSVITIKIVDIYAKNILHSCDFAVICEIEEDDSKIYSYIKFNKSQNNYIWETRKTSKDIKYKEKLIHSNHLWSEVKEIYMNKKNLNNSKTSHSMYLETINEVFQKNFK